MKVEVQHLGDVQFEIQARQHRIVSDQPESNGGFDEGVTPPELLLASVGSCMAYYAVEYLRRNQLAAEGTRVSVSAAKAKNPARLDDFTVSIETPAGLSPEHSMGVKKAAERCLIHATLQHPPHMRIEVDGQTAVPLASAA